MRGGVARVSELSGESVFLNLEEHDRLLLRIRVTRRYRARRVKDGSGRRRAPAEVLAGAGAGDGGERADRRAPPPSPACATGFREAEVRWSLERADRTRGVAAMDGRVRRRSAARRPRRCSTWDRRWRTLLPGTGAASSPVRIRCARRFRDAGEPDPAEAELARRCRPPARRTRGPRPPRGRAPRTARSPRSPARGRSRRPAPTAANPPAGFRRARSARAASSPSHGDRRILVREVGVERRELREERLAAATREQVALAERDEPRRQGFSGVGGVVKLQLDVVHRTVVVAVVVAVVLCYAGERSNDSRDEGPRQNLRGRRRRSSVARRSRRDSRCRRRRGRDGAGARRGGVTARGAANSPRGRGGAGVPRPRRPFCASKEAVRATTTSETGPDLQRAGKDDLAPLSLRARAWRRAGARRLRAMTPAHRATELQRGSVGVHAGARRLPEEAELFPADARVRADDGAAADDATHPRRQRTAAAARRPQLRRVLRRRARAARPPAGQDLPGGRGLAARVDRRRRARSRRTSLAGFAAVGLSELWAERASRRRARAVALPATGSGARRRGGAAVVRRRDRGRPPRLELLRAAGWRPSQACELLAAAAPPLVDATQPDGRLLHWACRNGHLDVARNSSRAASTRTRAHATARRRCTGACGKFMLAVAEWLVDGAGADLHARNSFGCNAMQWAAQPADGAPTPSRCAAGSATAARPRASSPQRPLRRAQGGGEGPRAMSAKPCSPKTAAASARVTSPPTATATLRRLMAK